MKRSTHRANGLTLIEVCVVIAIIAILLAFLVPALGRVRGKSAESINLANLRTHAAVMTTYAVDFKDRFFFGVPVDPGVAVYPGVNGSPQEIQFFEQRTEWPMILARWYAAGIASKSLVSPWAVKQSKGFSYLSPCPFRVDPMRYSRQGVEPLPALLRAIGVSEVQFPAAKSLVLTRDSPERAVMWAHRWRKGPDPTAFVDGHAESITAERMASGTNGEGHNFWMGACPLGQSFGALFHTLEGVRGRDVK